MRTALLGAVLVAAVIVSQRGSAAPCAGFGDVSDTDTFCSSIAWMKNGAITLGCGDGSIAR